MKNESSNPDLANRATVLVNKANKEDEDYSRKLTDFKCEFSEFFKLPTNEVQGVSSVASSNSNSRESSRDRNKVFYNYDQNTYSPETVTPSYVRNLFVTSQVPFHHDVTRDSYGSP